MHRRFRQLFSSLKEQSTVSYAKVATMGGFSDVDTIVVKATTPDDHPIPDRYVAELLTIFSLSPSSFRAFSLSFARRFTKTRSWRVALKSLLLLHRLLRSIPENTPFRSELIWARSSGAMSLHPCHFRDQTEDYTQFIKSYARLLDEALDSFSIDFKPTYDEELPESLSEKTKEVAQMVQVLPQLQSLMDRAMACRPAGVAIRNSTVQAAMKHIIRDSFTCYTTFRREMVLVLENLMQMPYRNCIAAFGIYKKAAVQASELIEFHEWCKTIGLCGLHEYPFIDRIPHIQIQALDTLLNGMWQLTESPSSRSQSPPSSWVGSRSTLTEDDRERQVVVRSEPNWEKIGEERPLIQLEDGEDESWEELLEAAVNENRSLELVVYTDYSYSGNPLYPWGL